MEPETDPHYIRAGWLFDGSGQPPQRDVLLRIENGCFGAIGSIALSGELSAVQVRDYSNCCILPPLVDCHVHLCMSGSTDPLLRRWQLTASYEELRFVILENIHNLFGHGVLAIRDGGDAHGHSFRFKAEGATVKENYPVAIRVAGRAWHQKGRYGALLGCCPQDTKTLAQTFSQNWQGTNQLKIIQSGINSLKQFGKETAPQFSVDELKMAVALAHERGLKVMVHANGRLPVSMAIYAGCDSIEHGFFMGPENMQRMAESGTTWIATAHTMQVMGRSGSNAIPGIVPEVAERTLEQQLGQLATAKEYGVKVAVGTDSGSWGVCHGAAMMEEMKLLFGAGYSLSETLRAATVHGAELLGIETPWGIAVGRPASFLVVEATPATLLSKLPTLQAIYLDGRCVTPLSDK